MSHRGAVVVLYGVGSLFALGAFGLVFLKSALIATVLLAVLASLVLSFYLALYMRIRRLQAEREDRPPQPVEPRVEPFSEPSPRHTQAR